MHSTLESVKQSHSKYVLCFLLKEHFIFKIRLILIIKKCPFFLQKHRKTRVFREKRSCFGYCKRIIACSIKAASSRVKEDVGEI